MKSLIRSDFYKLRKAKSFWVCMILAAAGSSGRGSTGRKRIEYIYRRYPDELCGSKCFQHAPHAVCRNNNHFDLHLCVTVCRWRIFTRNDQKSCFQKSYPHPDLSFQDNRFCHRRNRHDSPLRRCSYRSWHSSLGLWQS